MWLVSENGLSSPLCWKASPCNGLEDAVNNSKSGDTILVTNSGNRSDIFSLCFPGVLDKFLYFKGVSAQNRPKIGCYDDQRYMDERTNAGSEDSSKFYTSIKPILEITNGAEFENIWFDTGSIVIHNADVTFTNCTLSKVTIYIMGQDILSIYSLGYKEIKDIWHAIETKQMRNGSLQCQNVSVMFNNTTWNYVETIKRVDNETETLVDSLIYDGVQIVCHSITLNIFNSFLADKSILLSTIASNKINLVNSCFRGDVKGNSIQGGIKIFARDAPQITVENCVFEHLQYTDSFLPILYKHSKLCKYNVGAITVQMVSQNHETMAVGYLQIKHSMFRLNMGAVTITVTGDQTHYAKINIEITDSTFEKNFNLGLGGALSFAKAVDTVHLERNSFRLNSVGAMRAIKIQTGTDYFCSSFKYTPIEYNTRYAGSSVEIKVHVSNCTKDLKSCAPSEIRHIAITFDGNGGAIGMEEGKISMKLCSFSANSATEFGDSLYFGERTGYMMDQCTVTAVAFPYGRSFTVYAASTKGSQITHSVFTVTNVFSIAVSPLYHNTREIVDNVFVRNVTINCARSSLLTFVNGTATDPFGDQGHRKRIDETSLLGFIDLMFWCSLCSKDTYSLSGDKFNIDVQNVSEKVSYDKITCLPCPYGAICSEKVKPKPNMWGQIENNAIRMYSCPGGYCCAGSDCREYNSCAENRGSVLCGNCVKGYSEALFSPHCIPNSECSLLPFLLMLFGFGITYVVVFIFQKDLKEFLFAPVNQKKKPSRVNGTRRRAKNGQGISTIGNVDVIPEREVHANRAEVLPNIYVTQIQTEETSLGKTQISALKTSDRVDERRTPLEQEQIDFLPSVNENNEQPSRESIDGARSGTENDNKLIKCTTENDESQGEGGIFLILLFYYFQDAALVHIDTVYLNRDTSMKGTLKEIMGGLFQFRLDLFSLLDDICAMPDFTPVDKIVFRMSFVVIVFCLCIVIYSVLKLCEAACKVNVSKIQTKLTRAAMFAVLFSFQSVVSTLLKLIQCVSLGGKDVLLIDASHHCFTSWQMAMCIYVGACVAPFALYMTFCPVLLRSNKLSPSGYFAGCLFPLPIICYSLCRKERSMKTEMSVSSKALYNLLQGPYRDLEYPIPFVKKRIYLCWGGLYLARRLILVLLKVFIKNVMVRLSIMTLFSILSLFHHMIIWPCKERRTNVASFVSALALVIICIVNNLKAAFEVAEYIPVGLNQDAINAVQLVEDILVLWIPVSGVLLIFLVFLYRLASRLYGRLKG